MKKTSHLFFPLLILLGCVATGNVTFAQTNESSGTSSRSQISAQVVLQSETQTDGQNQTTSPKQTLTVTVDPDSGPAIIENVSFEGLQAVHESDVLKAFREKRVGIAKGNLVSAANFRKAVEVMKELLDAAGYLDATIEVRIQSITETSRVLTFGVAEGSRAVVKEIQFVGNKIFSGDTLRSLLKHVTASGYEGLDRSVFEYDLNNVRNYMRSRGYLKAKTLDPRYDLVDGGVRITVQVEEGRLFRIGEIVVEGSKRFSSEQIIALFGLKPGDIADGKIISDVLFDELKNLYENMGHPQYFADPDPDYRDNPKVANEGILDLRITISEGECFKVTSIKFQGNSKLSESDLRKFLLFSEGETYNRQLIKDSLSRIYESGLFEPIDFDADLDFMVNEDSAELMLTIKVTERQD